MPTFQVTKQEFHTVVKTYIEEFDTSDQDKWDHFRSLISVYAKDKLADFPLVAPEDSHVWFALLQLMRQTEYEVEVKDDWVSVRNGEFKTIHYLEDSYGEVLESTEVGTA
ncbi:hypothetical protein [Ferrovum myxofaciens]|jgi:hypothetical protein|uniref:Uncharacterized protein n=3 Tax=root TaxID=1 RepID=A0A859AA28_9PROT|nr:hypothetical protein [Ferrovum myxofaciens]KXW58862.1 hypothetical protein FEMY_05430 [Ferrovum myxofaciens]QKE39079.1 MAG: hypothetical protein HO273_10415 [Ferrovum myxofaciens]QKE41636.1 MAG: hypothetical protein HO274_10200 [Ferrovum myxofaciens]QWY74315.1 MAG: hypothetical protein JVY19_10960 [Ferrovum myxofaciens]QWY77066.1 MAG: hypothetical protein JZL65_11405 [Ferrovum myxofaciens]